MISLARNYDHGLDIRWYLQSAVSFSSMNQRCDGKCLIIGTPGINTLSLVFVDARAFNGDSSPTPTHGQFQVVNLKLGHLEWEDMHTQVFAGHGNVGCSRAGWWWYCIDIQKNGICLLEVPSRMFMVEWCFLWIYLGWGEVGSKMK